MLGGPGPPCSEVGGATGPLAPPVPTPLHEHCHACMDDTIASIPGRIEVGLVKEARMTLACTGE